MNNIDVMSSKVQMYLMNPYTGSVDTLNGWAIDFDAQSDITTMYEWLKDLVHVTLINDEWAEV